MKIKYIANDGKEFLTEEDCIRYERTMIPRMYNQKLERVYDFEQGVYFVVNNNNDREWIMNEDEKMSGEFNLKCDYDYPEDYGLWMWDMNRDCYTTLQEMIRYYSRLEDDILGMGRYN